MNFPTPTTQQLAKYILDFLDHIEGDGYGGMAEFEIARSSARDLAAAPVNPSNELTALLEIEQISDYCVNAEHYPAKRALTDLQEIRHVIKRANVRSLEQTP